MAIYSNDHLTKILIGAFVGLICDSYVMLPSCNSSNFPDTTLYCVKLFPPQKSLCPWKQYRLVRGVIWNHGRIGKLCVTSLLLKHMGAGAKWLIFQDTAFSNASYWMEVFAVVPQNHLMPSWHHLPICYGRNSNGPQRKLSIFKTATSQIIVCVSTQKPWLNMYFSGSKLIHIISFTVRLIKKIVSGKIHLGAIFVNFMIVKYFVAMQILI